MEKNLGLGHQFKGARFSDIQPWPAVFLGLGTTGSIIVSSIRQRLEQSFGVDNVKHFRFFNIDTDPMARGNRNVVENRVDFFPLSDLNGNAFVEDLDPRRHERAKWWPKWRFRKDGRIVEDYFLPGRTIIGAGGVRCTGRLCLEIQGFRPLRALSTAMAEAAGLWDQRLSGAASARYFSVYVVGTLCGGTCGGTFTDLAYWAKQHIPANWTPMLIGIFTLPSGIINKPGTGAENRYYANAYVSLRELDHFMNLQDYEGFRMTGEEIPPVRDQPFDVCYLIEGRNRRGYIISDHNDLGDTVAEAVFLEVISTATAKFQAHLVDVRQNILGSSVMSKRTAYSSFGLSVLHLDPEELIAELSHEAIADLINALTRGQIEATAITNWQAWLKSLNLDDPTEGLLGNYFISGEAQGRRLPDLTHRTAAAFRQSGQSLLETVDEFRRRQEETVENRAQWRLERRDSIKQDLLQQLDALVEDRFLQGGQSLAQTVDDLERLKATINSLSQKAAKDLEEQAAAAERMETQLWVGPQNLRQRLEERTRAFRLPFLGQDGRERTTLEQYLNAFRSFLQANDLKDLRANALWVYGELISGVNSHITRLRQLISGLENWESFKRTQRSATEGVKDQFARSEAHLVNALDAEMVSGLHLKYVRPLYDHEHVSDILKRFWRYSVLPENRARELPDVLMSFFDQELRSLLSGRTMLDLVFETKGEHGVRNVINALFDRSRPLWLWNEHAWSQDVSTSYSGPQGYLYILRGDPAWDAILDRELPGEARGSMLQDFVDLPSPNVLAFYQTEHGLPLFAVDFVAPGRDAELCVEKEQEVGSRPLYTRQNWPRGLQPIGPDEKSEQRRWWAVANAMNFIRVDGAAQYRIETLLGVDAQKTAARLQLLGKGRDAALQAFINDDKFVSDVMARFDKTFFDDSAAARTKLNDHLRKLRQLQRQERGLGSRYSYQDEEYDLTDFCSERQIVLDAEVSDTSN